ncbi:MAG: argininosuccinate lyase [Deltaproteobacteria bacterium]|nr:argininosuccinate lyase [Deltaproteobacteria bacterium]
MNTQKKKAWSGRFKRGEHPLMEAFNASLPFDRRLYAEDIEGSRVHARMLEKIGVLTQAEQKKIDKGLLEVKAEIDQGKFEWSNALEDIHMAIEARLTEKVGGLGGKLHTARSRNDQVALDLRLYARRQLNELTGAVSNLQKAILNIAEAKGFVPIPGYTHLQRAQVIYWAHHWLAYFEMLERDKGRIKDAHARVNVCPLGAGALAGSTFPVDREFTARELGFDSVSRNSLDTVSDRDFVVEILSVLSLIMAHLSRLSEELVLWSSQEFGFVVLPQEFCTGSSMMPQKMNPDAPELIRGKTGRVYGDLMGLLTVIKGLPLAYNKDLQEDKEPLFDALDTVFISLFVLTEMIPKIEVQAEAMKKATQEGFLLATDLADYLALKKVEFRSAHEIVGRMVAHCIEKGKTLENLSLPEMKQFSPAFEADVQSWLDVEASINRRKSIGGTARERVKAELQRAKKLVGE